jgi:hypothetical protein
LGQAQSIYAEDFRNGVSDQVLKKRIFMRLTRREAVSAVVGAGLASRCATAKSPPDLKEVAAAHVRIAERTRKPYTLWGRIGGSAAERESAQVCVAQLRPFVEKAHVEEFSLVAHRPATWTFRTGETEYPSVMPAPFNARFPDGEVAGDLAITTPDADWASLRGKWIFLPGEPGRAVMDTIVRERLLYQKAVAAGAIGFVFSIVTPADDTWQSVVPVDKPYAVKDERYPDGQRPIPCFSVDARDAMRLAQARRLKASVRYDRRAEHRAENAVGYLPGSKRRAIAVMCHLDSFFSGACDNASGIATMVGIAERLSQVPTANRLADFHFLGLAAHHDAGAGMRAFLERSDVRAQSIAEMILIEHTDALDLPLAQRAGWSLPLNDQRTAYLGPDGWPEVKVLLGELVSQSRLMGRPPNTQNACIGDLYVNCGKVKAFCLLNAPPIYHTDHDTMEWISSDGIQRAVDFHLRLFRGIGATQ